MMIKGQITISLEDFKELEEQDKLIQKIKDKYYDAHRNIFSPPDPRTGTPIPDSKRILFEICDMLEFPRYK